MQLLANTITEAGHVIKLLVLPAVRWYQVNYSMADDLVWGRNAGCRFAVGSCGEWIQRQQNK